MTITRHAGTSRRAWLVVGQALVAGVLLLPCGDHPRAEASPRASGVAQAGHVDPRWAPWLGCWRLLDENGAAGEPAPADMFVCVSPADRRDGVTLRTLVDEQPLLEHTIVADGTRHMVDEQGCRGWELTAWSSSGQRLFTRAEVACEDQASRTVSGFATMTSGDEWLDIQVIAIATRERIRVRRYQRATVRPGAAGAPPPADAESPPPWPVATPLTIDDVKEASARLSARAVEAALLETEAGFDLKSRHLLDLVDAGVPQGIIDLMVALSFPSRFNVQSTAPSRSSSWTDVAGQPILISRTVVDPYLQASVYPPFDYFYWGDYGPWDSAPAKSNASLLMCEPRSRWWMGQFPILLRQWSFMQCTRTFEYALSARSRWTALSAPLASPTRI